MTIQATIAYRTSFGTSTVNVTVPAFSTFVGADTTTKDTLSLHDALPIYSVANDSQVIPNYASFAVQNQANWTWAASTTDVRSEERRVGKEWRAARWSNSASKSVDVNFKDGNAHQLAFYAVYWNGTAREDNIQHLN